MMSRHRRNPRAAFTLIELLVAIGLMIILMGAVALIFFQSTDLFKTSEARMQIANNARTALDMLARDLAGSLPTDSNAQCFTMWNQPGAPGGGWQSTNGQDIQGAGSFGARDALQFWATTSFRGTVSGVHITYYAKESTDPEIMNQAGTAAGVRTGRNLMVLRRIARRRNNAIWDTDEADLCEYVLSFNVEPLLDPDDAGPEAPRFVNLDEPALGFRSAGSVPPFAPPGNPYNSAPLVWWSMLVHPTDSNPSANVPPVSPGGSSVLSTTLHPLYPIGCVAPLRATPNNIKPPMAIRITMRIVEGGAEKQERLISRVIWIPIQ